MNFIVNIKNKKITNEDILKDLKDVFQRLELPSLSMKDYDENGKYSSCLVSRRFASWNMALKAANIPCRQQYWTSLELMTNLSSAWIKKGAQPTKRDMNNKALSAISEGAYLRKYGSWNSALEVFANYIQGSIQFSNKENNTHKTAGHKTTRDINLRIRFLVMKRDRFRCVKCGRSPVQDPRVELHIDHIVPYSKGGETVLENLQTLCKECNLGKSNLVNE